MNCSLYVMPPLPAKIKQAPSPVSDSISNPPRVNRNFVQALWGA